MRSTYDSLIHGRYFPPPAAGPIPSRYRRIVDGVRRAHPRAVSRVVEVGPEVPTTAEFVATAFAIDRSRYLALDLSRASLDRLTAAGFEAREADVSSDPLPVPDGSVDVLLMCEVVEHLVDPDHALQEAGRVLADDGLLVITTPNLASWFNRALLLFGVQPIYTETGTEWVFGRRGVVAASRPVGHLRVLTSRSLRELLEYHGFDIVHFEGLRDDLLASTKPRLAWVDRLLGRFPTLAAGILAIGRRAGTTNRTP